MKISEAIKFIIKSSFLKLKYNKKPKVMNSNETLDYILKNKCSLARFGDGELSIMEGRNLKFQKYNELLASKLQQVRTNNKCLVCVPDIFGKNLNKKILTKEEYTFWKRCMLVFGGMWNKHFGKHELLGDAEISRFYIRYINKNGIDNYINKFKQIWSQHNIVFVEGKNSRLGVGNDLFNNAKTIKRILCPETNAFDKYDEILNSVQKNCKKDDLIILALGPTATVLAYELANLGYRALDLGHIDIEYEWFKMGATKKVPINNKHVNECNSMGDCAEEDLDKKYLDEIIDKIY